MGTEKPTISISGSNEIFNRKPSITQSVDAEVPKKLFGRSSREPSLSDISTQKIAAPENNVANQDKILFLVKVLYDYKPCDPLEIPVYQNDVIPVVAVEGVWWLGESQDKVTGAKKRGLFPSNYVEKCDS